MSNKKTVLIDTSSAIILYKADFFEIQTALFNIIISKSVSDELINNNYDGSGYFKELIQKGILSIKNPSVKEQTNEKLLTLGKGEQDILLLYLSGFADFIIIIVTGHVPAKDRSCPGSPGC